MGRSVRWRLILLLLIAVLPLSSCERGFQLRVGGTIAAPIFELSGYPAFGFIDFPRGPQPAIDAVEVYRVLPSGRSEPVWTISRDPSCKETRAIRYGVVPEGFRELKQAEPLKPRTTYVVGMIGCGFAGGVSFKFVGDRVVQANGDGDAPRREVEQASSSTPAS